MTRFLRWLLTLAAIVALWVAGTPYPPYQLRALAWERLTDEERRVVEAVARRGLSNKEAADALDTTAVRVRKVLSRLYDRLGIDACHKRPVLARWAWSVSPDWEVYDAN